MLALLSTFFWSLFRRLMGSTADEADVATLRHQVMVLQRQLGKRPKLTLWDLSLPKFKSGHRRDADHRVSALI